MIEKIETKVLMIMSDCSTDAPFCISPTPTAVPPTPTVSPTPTLLPVKPIEDERCEELVFNTTAFPKITSSKNLDINVYNNQITGVESITNNSFVIQQAVTIDKETIDINRNTIFKNIGDTRFNAADAFTFLKTRFKPLEPEDESFKNPQQIPIVACNTDGDPYTYYVNNDTIILDGCNNNIVILPIYDLYGQIISFPLKNSFNKLLTTEAITAIDATDQIVYFPFKNINNSVVCYPFRDLNQNLIFSLPPQNTERLVDVSQARANLSIAYNNARDAHSLKFVHYLLDLEKQGTCISFFSAVLGSSVTSLELENIEVFGVAVYKTCPDCSELTNYLSTYINCFIRYYPDRSCYVYDVYKKLGGKTSFTRINTEKDKDIFVSEKAAYLAYNILKCPFWEYEKVITLLPCERKTPDGNVVPTTTTPSRILDIYTKVNELSTKLQECCEKEPAISQTPAPTQFPTLTPKPTNFPTQTPKSTNFPTQTPKPTPNPTPAPTTPRPTSSGSGGGGPFVAVCDPVPVIIIENRNNIGYEPTRKFPGGTDAIKVFISKSACTKPDGTVDLSLDLVSDEFDWSQDKYPSSPTSPDNIMSRVYFVGNRPGEDLIFSAEARSMFLPATTEDIRFSPFSGSRISQPVNWSNKQGKSFNRDLLRGKECPDLLTSCFSKVLIPGSSTGEIEYTVYSQGVRIQTNLNGTNKWLTPTPTTDLIDIFNPCRVQNVRVILTILNNRGGILHPFYKDEMNPATGKRETKATRCPLGAKPIQNEGGFWALDMSRTGGASVSFSIVRPPECNRGDDPNLDGSALAFYWDKDFREACCNSVS